MADVNYKDAIPTLKDEIEADTVEKVLALDVEKYKYGFETEIETERAPIGLSEDTIRFISAKKGEPEWLLEWRLTAFRAWREMTQPEWAKVEFPPIDYQSATYYAAPRQKAGPGPASVRPSSPTLEFYNLKLCNFTG